MSVFQEGVNSGFGPYTGTLDTQISESAPGTSSGDSDDILIDFPDAGASQPITAQGLMRFENIFGDPARPPAPSR